MNNKNVETATVDNTVQKAFDVAEKYKRLPVQSRIAFLEQICVEISLVRHTLVAEAAKETFLPEKRLEGEIDRTINQIKMFVQLLKEGSWVNAIVDTAQPERLPLPKPDLRQMQLPLGVIGVFGASNFPFAFSVAGGDTISALAAGCPVVYKVHMGHPQTSLLVGNCILLASKTTGVPEGVFSMLFLSNNEEAIKLVIHPLVKAIAFTGSFNGGKALFDAAAARPEPIPVYAEMGSINPVFILPDKLKENTDEIAGALVASNTLGTGQFCTNPGLIIMLRSAATEQFRAGFGKSLSEASGGTMLTEGIYKAYRKGIEKLQAIPELATIGEGKNNELPNAAVPHAFSVSGSDFLNNKDLGEEYFGPSSVHVLADDKEQLLEIAANLSGQLTASVWASPQDCKEFESLFHILENKAGRLMINNAPTGVEVTHAMVHGGPYPATTDGKITSVGSRAIYRFTRPVCYQNFPDSLLPNELKSENPLSIWRLVNGEFTKDL